MTDVKVANQQELDAALKAGKYPILVGDGYFIVRGSSKVTAFGSSNVTARDSSNVAAFDSSNVAAFDSSKVTARDSSKVTAFGSSNVTAFGSSKVTAFGSSNVTARGSSNVMAFGSSNVTAFGSSNVTARDSSNVTARDSSNVTAFDSSKVTASEYVSVHKLSERSNVTGHIVIVKPPVATAQIWCEDYGAHVVSGVVTLYKAVDDNYKSERGFDYAPGSIPIAPDWDGGTAECGGGLHFCAHTLLALEFNEEATRFIACPVSMIDIVVHANALHPTKIKARGCCAAVWEVDIHMRPIVVCDDAKEVENVE